MHRKQQKPRRNALLTHTALRVRWLQYAELHLVQRTKCFFMLFLQLNLLKIRKKYLWYFVNASIYNNYMNGFSKKNHIANNAVRDCARCPRLCSRHCSDRGAFDSVRWSMPLTVERTREKTNKRRNKEGQKNTLRVASGANSGVDSEIGISFEIKIGSRIGIDLGIAFCSGNGIRIDFRIGISSVMRISSWI